METRLIFFQKITQGSLRLGQKNSCLDVQTFLFVTKQTALTHKSFNTNGLNN